MSFDHVLSVVWNAGIILYETSVENINIEEHNNRRRYEIIDLIADGSDKRPLRQVLVNMASRITSRA